MIILLLAVFLFDVNLVLIKCERKVFALQRSTIEAPLFVNVCVQQKHKKCISEVPARSLFSLRVHYTL